MIPTGFRQEHGSSLLDHAFLRTPDGKEHEVDLMTDEDDDVWFSSGWPAFANYYSLAFGSFLLFGYEGKSRFHVTDFEVSGYEIEYPEDLNKNKKDGDEDVDWHENEDDEDEDQGLVAITRLYSSYALP